MRPANKVSLAALARDHLTKKEFVISMRVAGVERGEEYAVAWASVVWRHVGSKKDHRGG